MRVNLLWDNLADARNGYLNISPVGGEGVAQCSLRDLNVVDDGEATELVAHDVLDMFPPAVADEVLTGWVRKLAHGGTIAISCVDLRESAKTYLIGNISHDEFNQLLYGGRQAAYTMALLVDALRLKGLQIMSKRVVNHRAIVVAKRP